MKAQLNKIINTLERLARLGNGEHYGNSDGNLLAQEVLPLARELEAMVDEPEQPQAEAVNEDTSDGYHTFKELYAFRKAYNAALFNEWGQTGKCQVHKSWRHHDGELCFGGGWFIVVAVLPDGQISNHYETKDWDLFNVPETEKALYEFDGHTGKDVIARLEAYKGGECAAPQQAEAVPNVRASFYTESAELIGTTEAPIKRVEREDDGTLHVYIDHWPQQAAGHPLAAAKKEAGQ